MIFKIKPGLGNAAQGHSILSGSTGWPLLGWDTPGGAIQASFTRSPPTEDPQSYQLLQLQPKSLYHIMRCSSFRHVLGLLFSFLMSSQNIFSSWSTPWSTSGVKISPPPTTPLTGYFPFANPPTFCPVSPLWLSPSQLMGRCWTKPSRWPGFIGKFCGSCFGFPIKAAFINARYDWGWWNCSSQNCYGRDEIPLENHYMTNILTWERQCPQTPSCLVGLQETFLGHILLYTKAKR